MENVLRNLNVEEDMIPTVANILRTAQANAYGYMCFVQPTGTFTDNPKLCALIHKVVRRIVLDGHINIGRIIGYQVVKELAINNVPLGNIIGLDTDMFSVSSSLSKIICRPSNAEKGISVEVTIQPNTIIDSEILPAQFRFRSNNTQTQVPVYNVCNNVKIAKCVSNRPITLRLVIMDNSSSKIGNINKRLSSENANLIPTYPSFSLAEHLRIYDYTTVNLSNNNEMLCIFIDYMPDINVKAVSNIIAEQLSSKEPEISAVTSYSTPDIIEIIRSSSSILPKARDAFISYLYASIANLKQGNLDILSYYQRNGLTETEESKRFIYENFVTIMRPNKQYYLAACENMSKEEAYIWAVGRGIVEAGINGINRTQKKIDNNEDDTPLKIARVCSPYLMSSERGGF